ncbi:hypothetical protein [Chthonobacter albigriseus]|uniref:hypothetical protein n=1 Tax=Chthonobacter albigriseus TaxID=1683161 RepID=UPI0015EF69A7|nr:hypothetical protein [Chthonobacter albigriseus]
MRRGDFVDGTAVLEADGRSDDELSPARLAAANIHPDTRLATDYLNHFNEVVMLIDMLPMMPDCATDVVAWQPRSYVDHFRLSHFKERDLAIRAYQAVAPDRRAAFEATVAEVERALGDVQQMIVHAPLDAAPIQAVQDLTEMRVKPLLSHAMGLINGAPVAAAVYEDESADTQSAIDALFE